MHFENILINKIKTINILKCFTNLIYNPHTKIKNKCHFCGDMIFCLLNRFVKEVMTWDEMEKEINFLYTEAEKLQMPICLSHNDLWHTNMLYDLESGVFTHLKPLNKSNGS